MTAASDLKSLIANPPQNEDERRALCEAARELYISLETPLETMHRLFWSIEQLPMVQIGIDLGLFGKMAAEPEKKWTVEELAGLLRADVVMLYRVMRYLTSFGLLRENTDSTYTATQTTIWLATPGAEGGVYHYLNTIAPVFSALPTVAKAQDYHNPTDPTKTAFNAAHQTDKPAYQWVPPNPQAITAFMNFMKSQREGQKSWTDAFPIDSLKLSDEELRDSRVMFVDVGGSTGGQCIALRQQHPDLPGDVVLQDMEMVVAKANSQELTRHNVKSVAHDFYQEQPVKGARAYHMRNVIHDLPDEKAIVVLQRLRDALAEDSMILIDEMVLPDVGGKWQQAQKDIQMMACLAAMERSETQWHQLTSKAGLKIRQICTYDKEMGDSIIVAVKA